MTDNEIIRALECCSNRFCYTCPLDEELDCNTPMTREALDLINRQKAEIERLRKMVGADNGLYERTTTL